MIIRVLTLMLTLTLMHQLRSVTSLVGQFNHHISKFRFHSPFKCTSLRKTTNTQRVTTATSLVSDSFRQRRLSLYAHGSSVNSTTTTAVAATATPTVSSGAGVSASSLEELLTLMHQQRGTAAAVDSLVASMRNCPGAELNLDLYRALYPFPLDAFQEEGLQELIRGNNVVVTTPTGSGKTLVGELAIYFALMMGLRVAYTTPLKALSNQKFQDFQQRYGGDRVGLLTGDIAVNRGAAVTVMTTEVFRNMIYDPNGEEQLANLFMVVFDEFHFMNDRERGTVWEESVISCPPSVRMLALSATMGNVQDIQGWMQSIHGPTSLVKSDHRPVPLRYFFAMKNHLLPLFRNPQSGPGAVAGILQADAAAAVAADGSEGADDFDPLLLQEEEAAAAAKGEGKRNRKQRKQTAAGFGSSDNKLSAGAALNPAILRLEQQQRVSFQKQLQRGASGKQRYAAKSSQQQQLPSYSDVAEELLALDKLPAIFFIFSRAGCEKAAQQVAQRRLRLLSAAESAAVNSAVANFLRRNPDIPVARASVALLRAGVGVHHAGLIAVWKALVEQLFNANLVKVLFATETLAAGVNMPARTTVISSVTKRINSNIVHLKPSQLLQMAGRAGRRGKDVEGSVVLMRNRFEDSALGHKILVTAVDGINSNFRTSYSLTVTLLETRSLDECRALIQKGFGAYLTQKRRFKRKKRKESSASAQMEDALVEGYRNTLRRFSLPAAREYLKLARRAEKEQRALQHLTSQLADSESEMVQAIADYMPMGTGVRLMISNNNNALSSSGHSLDDSSSDSSDDITGFFLGDVKWGYDNRHSGLGVITRDLRLFVVRKNHIRSFAEPEESLGASTAQSLLDLVSGADSWTEHPQISSSESDISNSDSDSGSSGSSGISKKKKYLEGNINLARVYSSISAASTSSGSSNGGSSSSSDEKLLEALEKVRSMPLFPIVQEPASIQRQREALKTLQQQLQQHPVVAAGREREVIDALTYAAQLKDPTSFVNSATAAADTDAASVGEQQREGDVFAWVMFQSVVRLLQDFGALEGTNSTTLGELVSSVTADNELWLALVLRHPAVLSLTAPDFAALMSALMVDGFKLSNAHFQYPPSAALKNVHKALQPLYTQLNAAQSAAVGVDFPINLNIEAAGVVSSWYNGTSWRDLCRETSLDQGDIYRIMRRTIEVLRQIPTAYGVPAEIVLKAEEAAAKLDRFPVADYVETVAAAAGVAPRDGIVVKSSGLTQGFEFSGSSNDSSGDEGSDEESGSVSDEDISDAVDRMLDGRSADVDDVAELSALKLRYWEDTATTDFTNSRSSSADQDDDSEEDDNEDGEDDDGSGSNPQQLDDDEIDAAIEKFLAGDRDAFNSDSNSSSDNEYIEYDDDSNDDDESNIYDGNDDSDVSDEDPALDATADADSR